MKVRFNLNQEVFLSDNPNEYYEKYLKDYGFIFDLKNEDVYKEIDKPIFLNINDNVELKNIGFYSIEDKYYDVENDCIWYILIEH
jgi:hypothetical protein